MIAIPPAITAIKKFLIIIEELENRADETNELIDFLNLEVSFFVLNDKEATVASELTNPPKKPVNSNPFLSP